MFNVHLCESDGAVWGDSKMSEPDNGEKVLTCQHVFTHFKMSNIQATEITKIYT